MKKAVAAGLGAVLVLGVAYVGASAWAGHRVHAFYAAEIGQLQAQVPALKIQQQYDKGLWSATSRVTLQFGCEPKDVLRLTVIDRIQHGPWVGGTSFAAADIDTELQIDGPAGQELAKMLGGAKPLVAHTVVGFGGGYQSDFSSPAGSLQMGEGQLFNWQGLQARVNGRIEGGPMGYELSMPSIELVDVKQGLQLKFAGLKMTGQAEKGDSVWLSSGRSEGEIGTIEMSAQAPAGSPSHVQAFALALQRMKFNAETRIEKDLLHTSSSFTASGQVGKTKLDRIELQASLKRLHAPTYVKLMEQLMAGGMTCDEKLREANAKAMLQDLQQSLLQMLPHNPEYALDKLVVEFGGKRGEFSSAVGVQGVTAEDLKQPLPMLLMEKAVVKTELKLPVAWIEMMAGEASAQSSGKLPPPEMVSVMLDQYAAQGFIVRDGEHLKSSLRYARGELLVNGKPLSLGGGAQAAEAGAEDEEEDEEIAEAMPLAPAASAP